MLSIHPITALFPQMTDGDLDALAADIRDNGLRDPVWLFEDKILDGRNRYLACERAGVQCQTRVFRGTRVEAVSFVWSMNRQRRHLNPSQAAVAEAKRANLVAEYAEEIEKIRAEAAERQKKAGREGGSEGGRGRKKTLREFVPQGFRGNAHPDDKAASHGVRPERKQTHPLDKHHMDRTSTRRAKAAGTNRKYLEAAERLVRERPDMVAAVECGEKTIPQVTREIKAESRRRSLDTAVKAVRSSDLAQVAEVRHCSMEVLLASHGRLRRIAHVRARVCAVALLAARSPGAR